MPRIKKGLDERARQIHPDLTHALTEELRTSRESGQPRVEEEYFRKTNLVKVVVIWDRWDGIADEDRAEVILQAYAQAEGEGFRDRIALAIGVTVPEAIELGHLPFRICPAVRPNDAVTLNQCYEAMLAEGASLQFDPEKPELRFATAEEAEACRKRLERRLPQSRDVWLIEKDVSQVLNKERHTMM